MPSSPNEPQTQIQDESQAYRVIAGDQQCPRCQKRFTMSYWRGRTLVQARCLSCDLKWPRPDVV